MASDVFQITAEKVDALEEQKTVFDTLISRAEAAKKKGQTISLPEFTAFGWARFGEFLNRFEDAVNSPLLERVRSNLENAGVAMSTDMKEKLKIGLTFRGEKLVEAISSTTLELDKIRNLEIKEKAKQGTIKAVEGGKWDDLTGDVNKWYQLEQQLGEIIKEKNSKTLLYNSLFDLALQEGPASKLAQTLRTLEDTAFKMGGNALKQQIRVEPPENLVNPLSDIDAKLNRIAQGKEKTRQVLGVDTPLDNVVKKGLTLSGIIEAQEKEFLKMSQALETERQRAAILVTKYNNLAVLQKENMRSFPTALNMKELEGLVQDLEKSIRALSQKLEKSLSLDAREFIENLLEGKVPSWDAQRVFNALQELLNKGFSFEIKLREGR